MNHRRSDQENEAERALTQSEKELAVSLSMKKQSSMIELEEKAKNRETYRDLCTQLEEMVESKASVDEVCDAISYALKQVDEKFKLEADGKQLSGDADVLVCSAKALMMSAKSLDDDTTDKNFNGSSFSERLVDFLISKRCRGVRNNVDENPLMIESDDDNSDHDEDELRRSATPQDYEGKLTRSDWAFFGRKCLNLMHGSPSFCYNLRPSVNFQSVPRELKVKKERNSEKDDPKNAVVLRAKTEADGANDEISVSKELDWVRRCLRAECKKKNKPVDYFRFVMDPEFGKTVENMFYVSFLIKDGQVCFTIDDNGLPVLSFPPESVRSEMFAEDRTSRRSHQAIMSFSYANWQRFKTALKVDEPTIPPMPTE